MFNVQFLRVPFIAAFPNGPYSDFGGVNIILSGDYFLATAAPEDFEEYQTGFRSFFSGSGNWGPGASGNTGPGSGFSFLFTRYFFDTFESYTSTGIFQTGLFLNSGLLQSGYLSLFSPSLTGATYGIDNIYFESFTGYATGQNTGLFPGLFTNNYINLMHQNLGINSGFVNYNLLAVFESFTGYSTGFFFNPFGNTSLNNPNLNSGLLISGWNDSIPFKDITYSSSPVYFINSGILSGYWVNATGTFQSTFSSGTINPSGLFFSGTYTYYPYNTVRS